MSQTIVYLHGFQSSPKSIKAQLLKQAVEKLPDIHFICPQLDISPQKSIQLIEKEIEQTDKKKMSVIGSSLGGFYANWIAQKYSCRAVLINPIIDPWKIKILDEQPQRDDLQVREWHDFTNRYQQQLLDLKIKQITLPDRYLLLAAKGDELLDWKLMCSHYKDAHQIIIDEGDHGLSCFPSYIQNVLSFCLKND